MTRRKLRIDSGRAAAIQAEQGGSFSRAKSHYASLRQQLESRYFGSYVMFDVDTLNFVVAPTTSMVHAKFIEKFGHNARGWCTRVGVSALATA